MLRLFIVLSLVIASTSFILAQENPKLKFGVTLPLSGPWANWGSDLRQGLELAANTSANIELVFVDDRCEAMNALTNVRNLLSQHKVDGIIAGCVEVLDAIAPVLKRQQLPLFALGGMDEELLQRNPLLISLFAVSDIEARYLAQYLTKTDPQSKIALIHHSQRFGLSFGDGFTSESQRLGLKITARESLSLEEVDFKAELTRVLATKPEIIIIHMGENGLLSILEDLRHREYSGKIYTTHVLEILLKKLPTNNIASSLDYTYPTEVQTDTAEYKSFQADFVKRFSQSPTTMSATAFDALSWIQQAYLNCNKENAKCIKQQFIDKTLSGVSGELKLDDLGRSFRPYGLKHYENFETHWIKKKL